MEGTWGNWSKFCGVLCERRMPLKLKGEIHRTVVRPASVNIAETKDHEKRLAVNEMRMLRLMCGGTKKIKSEANM